MLHTRLQIDPNAVVNLRAGNGNEVYEIAFLDPNSDASVVVSLPGKLLAAIAEQASEM